jgi:hypothetical protein
MVDLEVFSFDPATLTQSPLKRLYAELPLRIVQNSHQHADPPHRFCRLLCAGR